MGSQQLRLYGHVARVTKGEVPIMARKIVIHKKKDWQTKEEIDGAINKRQGKGNCKELIPAIDALSEKAAKTGGLLLVGANNESLLI